MQSLRAFPPAGLCRRAAALLAAAGLASPALLAAQSATAPAVRITASQIDGHLRFLSSDLLEGRAPATRGGRLAAEYIASQLRASGVEPGVNGSYFQAVPIDVVKADPSTIRVTASGKASGSLRFTDDVVVWAGSATDASAARGELVFVGYGATAPEYRWDDFKGMDVKGKVLLVLVNDPPAPPSEPKLFGGKAMTYYGRWTYKYEEAERRGAAGMLIVHTTERAGYPWQVVVGSNSVEHRLLPRDASGAPPIGVRGWITDSAATALLRQAGLDLSALRTQAESRDFKPVSTGIVMDMSFRNSVAHMQSENVVGVVRGRDSKLKDEYVAYSAHWDHLGVGPAVNGDSIYNGASDNASGVADLLAVARAAAEGSKTRRSQLFIFVTAEESGLLGSAYFAEHPTVPASSIVANLNVDGGNVLGRTRDLDVLGDNKSTLGPMLAHMVAQQGMKLSPDEHPEQGHFYRSDHFSFAKAGIPSVSIGSGNDFIGRPAGWGRAQGEDYTAKRYHQPSDQYRADFDLAGAVQLSEIVFRFGRLLANSPVVPTWNADAEFRAVRKSGESAAR
jgi:Zn-dependent M28 family amino/carboxypeptidase